MKHLPHIIVVAGPTASGKSDFAVHLALQLSKEQSQDCEIISADSRQIYKGLDIGTGKITEEEMKGVKHHMIDIVNLQDEFSVARYQELARPILLDILARGKTPIICGGTGQYIDALIYSNTFPKSKPDHILREQLEKKTTPELYEELFAKDSRRAEMIDMHNRVRLIRALEIVHSLGAVPIQSAPSLVYTTTIYLMSPTRELLRERVRARLEKRLASGMTEEVKNVLEKGYKGEALKRFGLEYFVIGKYIEEVITKEHMKEELLNKIMQYAKRQETWNKKYQKSAIIVH